MTLPVSVVYSLLLLSYIPLRGYNTVYPATSQQASVLFPIWGFC